MSAMAVLLRQLIDSVRARVITEPSPASGDQRLCRCCQRLHGIASRADV